jgi:hypothetical protein
MDNKTINRFLDKVMVDDVSGCWNWTADIDKDGYGRVRGSHVWALSHRRVYELFIGPIPDGLHILHSCDNRRCVNPCHLHAGTNADNMAEKVARGRQPSHKGEKNPCAKLNYLKAERIRKLFATGKYTKAELGRRFEVSDVLIGKVVRHELWG